MKKLTKEEARVKWQVWRNFSDRITSHPDYRYDSPRKWPLLRMARFCYAQMALYNRLAWNECDTRPNFTGLYDGHYSGDYAHCGL